MVCWSPQPLYIYLNKLSHIYLNKLLQTGVWDLDLNSKLVDVAYDKDNVWKNNISVNIL